jgi:hypothetical protein
MVPRGVLLPVKGGFEVYLRDLVRRRDVELADNEATEPTDPSAPDFLTTRQRFSLAHEIAHTLFYKAAQQSVPLPEPTVKNPMELEDICDRTAGFILLPTHLLKREVGDSGKINAAFVKSVASRFRASVVVTLERLAAVESSNPFERCVLLARRQDEDDAEIRACYYGVGLLPTLPRPKKYTLLSDWISDFPRHEISRKGSGSWSMTRQGRLVRFMKTELGARGEFLLEANVLSATSAHSGPPAFPL